MITRSQSRLQPADTISARPPPLPASSDSSPSSSGDEFATAPDTSESSDESGPPPPPPRIPARRGRPPLPARLGLVGHPAPPTAPATGSIVRRMQWSQTMNENCMRAYFGATEGGTNLSAYRVRMLPLFQALEPTITVSAQRLSDQVRVIQRHKRLDDATLDRLRLEALSARAASASARDRPATSPTPVPVPVMAPVAPRADPSADEECANQSVNGSWGLPAFVCDIYIAMDVTSSTSSIFNLVAISIDRYIAVTQPIKYAKHKNNRRVWFTIVLVWLISAAIGTPVVLGLNDTPDRNYDECLFNSQNYVIYSSLGSFYIPCIMMMFLYYSIFKALRIRARKQRAAKKPPVPEGSQAVVIENVAQTRRLAETALDAATNTGSGSNEDDHDSFDKRSVELEDAEECHVIPNDKSTEFMLAARDDPPKIPKLKLTSDPNGNNDSGYAPSSVEPALSPPGSPAPAKNGTRLGLEESRIASLALCTEEEPDTVSQFGDCKKERKASAATARFTIYKANKASKKKREKSSAKKERKATKTLAIVLGVFLFCWAPFFTCSVLDAVCGKLGLPYSPGVTVFILTTWLGYINSFLNPVIYTIFNPEFRKAFRKILHCGT